MKPALKTFWIVVMLMIGVFELQAQAPQLLNYQGKLTNKDGTPTTGSFDMTFYLYQEATGGTALWQESQKVAVTNGVFNVLLGSSSPLAEFLLSGNGNRYLGIKVENEPEMTPRFLLSSVPYAVHAAIADSVKDNAITYRKQTIATFKASDNSFKRHTGTGKTKISEFKFSDVPAGDIYVVLTCLAKVDLNSNTYGSVDLEIGSDNSVQSFPTHILESNILTQITLHSCLKNFSGGLLIVRLIASGEWPETSFKFGAENSDSRFGRWVTVIAGL